MTGACAPEVATLGLTGTQCGMPALARETTGSARRGGRCDIPLGARRAARRTPRGDIGARPRRQNQRPHRQDEGAVCASNDRPPATNRPPASPTGRPGPVPPARPAATSRFPGAPPDQRPAASPAAACLSAWGREGRPGPARSRSVWSPPGSGALRGTAAPGRLPGSGHGVTGPSTARRALCARVAVPGPTRARPSPGSGPLTEPRGPRLPRRLRAGLAAEGAQR